MSALSRCTVCSNLKWFCFFLDLIKRELPILIILNRDEWREQICWWFTRIQDGEGEGMEGSPTSLSPVTSTNVGLVHKTLWLLVSTLLPHWSKISWSYLVPVPNYWTWTKITPLKKQFFWSNPYKIEVMINFSYRNARVTKIWSHDHIYNISWITW